MSKPSRDENCYQIQSGIMKALHIHMSCSQLNQTFIYSIFMQIEDAVTTYFINVFLMYSQSNKYLKNQSFMPQGLSVE